MQSTPLLANDPTYVRTPIEQRLVQELPAELQSEGAKTFGDLAGPQLEPTEEYDMVNADGSTSHYRKQRHLYGIFDERDGDAFFVAEALCTARFRPRPA